MPLSLLKYTLSDTYPETEDIPATLNLKPSHDALINSGGIHNLAYAQSQIAQIRVGRIEATTWRSEHQGQDRFCVFADISSTAFHPDD